jgi:hypothetical protein
VGIEAHVRGPVATGAPLGSRKTGAACEPGIYPGPRPSRSSFAEFIIGVFEDQYDVRNPLSRNGTSRSRGLRINRRSGLGSQALPAQSLASRAREDSNLQPSDSKSEALPRNCF